MYTPESDSTILTWRGATVRLFPPHDSYVYLIHFKTPYKHARHYLGATSNLEARLHCHQQGNGARLMEVITQAGIEWEVSRLWRFDTYEEARAAEAHFKKRHGSVLLCPICQHKPVDSLVALRQGHWPLVTFARPGKRQPIGRSPHFVVAGQKTTQKPWYPKWVPGPFCVSLLEVRLGSLRKSFIRL